MWEFPEVQTSHIDPEALRLIEKADPPWYDRASGSVEARNP
jgi:hypothetical protein